MNWDSYLPLAQELEKNFPQTDVLSVSDSTLAEMLSSLPMTRGWGEMPREKDFFYRLKIAWVQIRRTEEAETAMEADL